MRDSARYIKYRSLYVLKTEAVSKFQSDYTVSHLRRQNYCCYLSGFNRSDFRFSNLLTSRRTAFWVVMPYSSEEVRRFGGKYHLHIYSRILPPTFIFSSLAYSSTPDTEAVYSPETSGSLRNTRHCYPEGSTVLTDIVHSPTAQE